MYIYINCNSWLSIFITIFGLHNPTVLAQTETNETLDGLRGKRNVNPMRERGDENLDAWTAPDELIQNYVYYLSGYDYGNHPVWIVESGKWNYRKIVERGDGAMATFDKYIDQVIHRMTKSFQNLVTPDGERVTRITLISDMDGFSMTELAHVSTVSYILRISQRHRNWFINHLHLSICLNTNAMGHSLINFMRPVAGPVFERIEVYGTQRSTWQSVLFQNIPHNQLPPKYGGVGRVAG